MRVGFRTLELVQNPLPGGNSYASRSRLTSDLGEGHLGRRAPFVHTRGRYYFRVSGVPIPVKGSNWIPADAFESRVSRNGKGTTRLEPLFWALRDSHQVCN